MYCIYTANLSLSVFCDITTEEKVPLYMLKLCRMGYIKKYLLQLLDKIRRKTMTNSNTNIKMPSLNTNNFLCYYISFDLNSSNRNTDRPSTILTDNGYQVSTFILNDIVSCCCFFFSSFHMGFLLCIKKKKKICGFRSAFMVLSDMKCQ